MLVGAGGHFCPVSRWINGPTPAAPVVVGEPAEEPAPVVEAPPRAPVRIGLGLRKTRENFLARIRAALTGSAKIDDIYEGLEEALIAAHEEYDKLK